MDIDRALIVNAAQKLSDAGIDSAEHDAVVLLEHATTTVEFDQLVAQRVQRVPLQHLTGKAYFRYVTVAVGEGVFVPRPETELLAQVGIDVLAELVKERTGATAQESPRTKPVAFDLCSGSGTIALSLATEVSNVIVHAVEKSTDAVQWLLNNVEQHSGAVEENNSRVTVHALDATDESKFLKFFNTADVVISNPPYIPNDMIPRDPEVRDYDPHLALFGGPDGLDVPVAVARVAAQLLKDGGTFAMEHADVQGDGTHGLPAALREMTDLSGEKVWEKVVDHTDYNGLPRYTTARRAMRATPTDELNQAKNADSDLNPTADAQVQG